jgi:urease accessory protein
MTSDPVTSIEAGWVVGLLQTGDSFYPTGSYAHSFGLEGLVQEGVVRDRETLRQFMLLAVRPALQRTELPLAAHAWRALAGPDWARVGEISVLAHALKTAREARQAAENIGRQRVEFINTLRPDSLAAVFLEQAVAGGWPYSPPVAAALGGRVLGAPLPAVLAGVYYSTVVALLAAAMKLLRLGQNGAQTLLTEMLAAAPEAIAAASELPLEEAGWFNPWLDIAAARHERADGRLFIS